MVARTHPILVGLFALAGCLVGVAAANADMLERLAPARLQSVRESIEALQSKRRPIKLSSGFEDVRTLLHVHSAFSHDSRGTIEEIVAAADEARVRVILFSEHPNSNYDYFLDGHRGVKNGILLVPGAETEGFLAYPRQSMQNRVADSPQALANSVRATGGLVFLSHLEERMDWEIANLTGCEIYNTHADFKDEASFSAAIRAPLTLIGLSAVVQQYPQETFGALLDYPAEYLRRYDQLCQRSPHTGVSANDAHHNQAFRGTILESGEVVLEDALGSRIARMDPDKFPPIKLLLTGRKPGDRIFELDLDPYVRSFRHVSTHLLLTEVSQAQVWEALSAGRAYVAFDWIADPTGFVYLAEGANRSWPVGSEIPLESNLRLRAEAPLEARYRLVRNGEVVFDRRAEVLEFEVETPGVYRVEAWLPIAGEDRPWILTNPIYVREKSPP
jgi:hypothetical protein